MGCLNDAPSQTRWQTFFDTYWRLIYNFGLKTGLTEAEAESLVQRTVLKVVKAMRDSRFEIQGPALKGWLLQITTACVWEHIESRSDKPPESQTSPSPKAESGQIPLEWETFWEKEWEENLVRAALERARELVEPKDFQIFDLFTIKHRPLKEVRQFLGVGPAEVYLARRRVSKLVRQEIARLRRGII